MEEQCAMLMSMGMSYEDYWYGDVYMVYQYAEAYRLKKRQENDSLWLQGLYFHDAISVALRRFGDGLSGKTSHGNLKYPEKPYDLFQKAKTEAEKEAEVQAERQRAYDNLVRIVNAFKAQHGG